MKLWSLVLNIFICLLCFLFPCLRTAFCLDDNPSYVPLENITLDCGSFGAHVLSYDSRNWIGDVGSKFVASNSGRNSTTAEVSSMDPSVPEVPYKTARIFRSKFSYTFNVSPGPKFVRLHFYPSNTLQGLDTTKAFLSVNFGHYTLLRNFSASLTANDLNVYYFFKEFIIHVEGHTLELMFSPSSKSLDAFAFVNGIELFSMPHNLYLNGEKLRPLVGYSDVMMTLDDNCALETVYRINVGGQTISPRQDTGMYRTWIEDGVYIFGAAFGVTPYDFNAPIQYPPSIPAYTAPESLYRTARSMGEYYNMNINYNLSWFFPVDTGFMYLVRLHYCEVLRYITKVNQQVFDVYINNQTAARGEDIIAETNGYGVPTYKDYVVMIWPVKEGRQDLWLELHPNTKTKSQFYDAMLNGVEIFKISNSDRNLAGFNPPQSGFLVSPTKPSSSSSSSKKKVLIIAVCLPCGVIVAALLWLLALWLKKKRDTRKKMQPDETSLCHRFTIGEIKKATNNFDEAQIIGTGGFGVVYKGCINGARAKATMVAIKRGNQTSSQGFNQFEAEIKALSHLRHQNIVSLIGDCNEENEMILVYEYMSNGTLFDHLHLAEQLQLSPLSWIQRLEICVGAARGVHYLHTATKQPIIHRDIKTTNILMDNEWVGKVSDFGLSKAWPETMVSNSNVRSISIKGSIGYMDPEYYRRCQLTEKSDVYSFGVVLLEVLSANLVLNQIEDNNCNGDGSGDHESFVEWALNCIKEEEIDHLIDPHLRGKMKTASLAKFLETAQDCLSERSVDRPSMSEVLCSLELALQLQLVEHDTLPGARIMNFDVLNNNSDSMLGVEFSEIIIPVGR